MIALSAEREKPNRIPKDATAVVAAMYRPAKPRRSLPLYAWTEIDDLVGEVRRVGPVEPGIVGADLDSDGSALLLNRARSGEHSLRIEARDGTSRVIAVERDGLILDASIDRGRCAWWHADPKTGRVTMRTWDPVRGIGDLGDVGYELDDLVDEPAGCIVRAGDMVVGSVQGKSCEIVAGAPGRPATVVGGSRFIGVQRDLVAELRGVPRVGATLFGPETDKADELVSLDLRHFPPKSVPLRRAVFPGASVAWDDPVAYWGSASALELPGGLAVPVHPPDIMPVDPSSDGEFAAFSLFVESRDRSPRLLPVVLHLASAARFTGPMPCLGRVFIRGGFVMWTEVVATDPRLCAVTVGRLRSPRVIAPVDSDPDE